jgi:hypothetical protein
MNERLSAHPIYISTNFPLTREAGPKALFPKAFKKVEAKVAKA